MSGLKPGTYVIVSKDASYLAVQYHGEGRDIDVQRRKKQLAQEWVVRGNPDEPQSISPAPAQRLQTAPVGNYIQPGTAAYKWNITPYHGAYQIQNEDYTLLWALRTGFVGEYITLQSISQKGPGIEDSLQSWYFVKSNDSVQA